MQQISQSAIALLHLPQAFCRADGVKKLAKHTKKNAPGKRCKGGWISAHKKCSDHYEVFGDRRKLSNVGRMAAQELAIKVRKNKEKLAKSKAAKATRSAWDLSIDDLDQSEAMLKNSLGFVSGKSGKSLDESWDDVKKQAVKDAAKVSLESLDRSPSNPRNAIAKPSRSLSAYRATSANVVRLEKQLKDRPASRLAKEAATQVRKLRKLGGEANSAIAAMKQLKALERELKKKRKK